MASSPIGNAGALAARELSPDGAQELGFGRAGHAIHGAHAASRANQPLSDLSPAEPPTDVSSLLMSEVATSDLTKLTTILDPSLNSLNSTLLDGLIRSAVDQVQRGNPERAIGYLADYATRDPLRGEHLSTIPALEPVRDKIDSMVTRMTNVARMSAENGLSEAERMAEDIALKLPTWDTGADVLLKLAHRLYDAGGYANYARSTELARAVTIAALEQKSGTHAFAASASAAQGQFATSDATRPEIIPGINVPYWAQSPDFPILRKEEIKPGKALRKISAEVMEDIEQNLADLKTIAFSALRQLWHRAPLLVILLTWLSLGLPGAVTYAICNHFWPDSSLTACGNLMFGLWGLGFLALVGFAFYIRIRYRPINRN